MKFAKVLGLHQLAMIFGGILVVGFAYQAATQATNLVASSRSIVAIAVEIEIGQSIASTHWPGGAVPYSWGGGHGSSPGPSMGTCSGYTGPSPCRADQTNGVDCSGFARWVYSIAFGSDVLGSGGTNQQIALSKLQPVSAANAVPGDLVFFGVPGNVHHVGIYIGNGKMINALHTGTNVETDNLLSDLVGYYHYQGASQGVSKGGSFTVIGAPTINAPFIDKVLAANHSPAQGSGQAFYDYGMQYNIDPAFALAFFQHESSFGTTGVASHTMSIGNTVCTNSTPANLRYESNNHCFQMYTSWSDSIQQWYKMIRTGYVDKGNVTIDQIIPIYAPPSDGNDDSAYISAVENSIASWRSGKVS